MNRARHGKAFVVAAIFLTCCSCVLALNPSLDINQYAHKSWKVREGFFNGRINTLAQTSDGYLWIGSDLGLYRFDGVRSVPWRSLGNKALPSNIIRKLFVSRDGTLWIGTEKGLVSWKDGELTLYPDLPAEGIDAIVEDNERTVWTGLESVPAWRLCSIKKGGVQCFGSDGTLGSGKGALLSDKKGNLWAGTGTSLWRWEPGTPQSIPLSGSLSEIHALIEDEHHAVLASTRGGIIKITDSNAAIYRLPDYAGQLNPFSLLRDRDGGFWIGTKDRGLLHVHLGRTDHFGKSDGLSSDSVSDLFEDREGNIWVGTASGLDHFHEVAVSRISDSPGFSAASVESVLTARDGSIWLGTRDGLDRWQDGRLILYRKRRAKLPSTLRQTIDPGLPDDFQSALYQDHLGRIWVFSRAGAAYADEHGDFRRVPDLPGGFAHSIAEDNAGDLWISQDQGFFHLLHGGKVEQIAWAKSGVQGLPSALAADRSSGGLWLGFHQGGLAYLKDGQVRRSYTASEGLGEGSVSEVQVDQDGTVWAGSEGGLSHLKNGHINTLSSQNGLPCNSIKALLMRDNARSTWLQTGCGLVRIARSDLDAWVGDPKLQLHTTVFDSTDGLTPVGMPGGLSPRIGQSKDGKIWFVSGDGISVIDPEHLPFNEIPPRVYIEQITADEKTHSAAYGVRLPALVRNLAIDYTALSLVVPEKVHFRYMLEGQDKDWREVVNDRQVQYSNLAPKRYRFRVTACNNSGVWNEEGAALEFVIPPAWYQTHWFRVLCVGLLLALIYAAHRFRVRQLHRQEKKLRDVIETVPAFAWTARPDGSIDFANRNWMEYSGLSPDQTVGSGWQVAVHEADFKHYRDKWRAAVERGVPFENEVRFRRADGQYRWFLVRGVPLRDARGKIVRWYGTSTDIEDRKRAEEALRRSEAYLNEAQRLTRTCSWASDGKTREVLYWSDEGFRIFGVDPKKDMLTKEQAWQKIHAEDRAKVKEASDKTFREKVDYEVEYRIVLPDGTVKHIHSLGHPVLNADGDIVEVVGTNIDITERKLSEAALRRSEAYLAGAQKLTHTGSWAIDGKSRELRYWSEEMFGMYGFDPQQGLPKLDQARQRIHPEDRGKVEKRDNKTFFEKADADIEFRIVLPDGTIKHIHALAHPVLGADGELVEVVGTNVDITERKRTEQLQADLAHTNRVTMLGELAASISHELKQPIAATITNANTSLRWLKRDQPDLDEVRQATERIAKDGKRATEIIDRLRSLYKKTPPKREPVDVNEIIGEMVLMLRGEANRSAISIRTDLATDLPKITADRVQLQQVLMNLMLNGIEAMKETGGVLTVKSQPNNGRVVISVSDTGIGLPTDRANKIFDAFFTTKPQGSGIGLAISRSIIESHGGRIWATPNDGRGASFHFSLPTATEAAEAPATGM